MISKLQCFLLLLLLLNATGSRILMPALESMWKENSWELYRDSLEDFKFGAERLVMLEMGVSERRIKGWSSLLSDVKQFVHVVWDSGADRQLSHVVESIHVETMNLNEVSLTELCVKYGPFDIIVDCANYSADPIVIRKLFPCMSKKAYYFIDLSEGISASHDATLRQITGIYPYMHDYWSPREGEFFDPIFSGQVKSIQMMEGLILIEKGSSDPYTEVARGTERVAFSNPVEAEFFLLENRVLNVKMDITGLSTTIPHEALKAECRALCTDYPELRSGRSVEDCATRTKQSLIVKGFLGEEDFLFGGEPLEKSIMHKKK